MAFTICALIRDVTLTCKIEIQELQNQEPMELEEQTHD